MRRVPESGHADAVAVPRRDAGIYVLVAGLMLVAFFASYIYARATSNPVVQAADLGGAPSASAESGGAEGSACGCCGSDAGEIVEGETEVTGDVQTVYVDASGAFTPNAIRAVAGIPMEITFSEGSGCMDEVYLPDFGVREDLTSGGAVIALPGLDAGEYGFSCGMEMVFGSLVVE